MAEDYCELMDMPASMCSHCRGSKSVEEQIDAETAALRHRLLGTDIRWFSSQWSGRCAKCQEFFEAGALIRRGHPGIELIPDTLYVAECCAPVT
jgi:hypothetical protein